MFSGVQPYPVFQSPVKDFSVLTSSDHGQTWQALDSLGVTGVWTAKLAVSPSDPRTVYVAYENTAFGSPLCGIFPFNWALRRTTDGGSTAVEFQARADVLLPISRYPTLWCGMRSLLVHPAIATTVHLGLQWAVDFDGLYSGYLSSADSGSNWLLSFQIGLAQLLAEPGEPFTLYAKHMETYLRIERYSLPDDLGTRTIVEMTRVK
jgi:hypothetical protein